MDSTRYSPRHLPAIQLRGGLLILALLVFTTGPAQTIRVKGGLNLTGMYALEKYDHSTYRHPFNPGLHLGGTVDWPLSRKLSIESGVFLSSKGFKRRQIQYTSVLTYTMKTDIHFLYLEVPVMAKYTIKKSGRRFYGQAGPYLGMALLGRYNRATVVENDTQSTTTTDKGWIKWLSGGGDYRRLDYGLMLGAGMEVRSMSYGLTYGLGLAKNRPEADTKFYQRHSVISLSAGYRF